MIFLARFEKMNEEHESSVNHNYTINVVNNIINIEKKDITQNTNVTLESINLNDLFSQRISYDVFEIENNTNKLLTISIPQQRNVRDGVLLTKEDYKLGDRLLSFTFGDVIDDTTFFFYKSVSTELPITKIDDNITSINIIQLASEYFPYLKTKADSLKIKHKILRTFDAHSVLAYLEAQVDLLSLILESIIKNNPNIIIDDTLDINSIFEAISSTNVTTVKDITACLGEIKTTKANLRIIQDEYIKTKG